MSFRHNNKEVYIYMYIYVYIKALLLVNVYLIISLLLSSYERSKTPDFFVVHKTTHIHTHYKLHTHFFAPSSSSSSQ